MNWSKMFAVRFPVSSLSPWPVRGRALIAALLVFLPVVVPAQTPTAAPALRPPTRADVLRGEYGRYRANNDLLHYDLDIRVDPDKKFLSGRNSVRFRMLKDDTRVQLDLYANLTVDRILMGTTAMASEWWLECQYFRCAYLTGEPENRDAVENADVLWVPRRDLTRFLPADNVFPPILRSLDERTVA